MRIALIDVDFNEGVALGPNPWLTKVSSYYKQLGHKVDLVASVRNIDSFDTVVIAKELSTSLLPNLSLLTNSKTKLIGNYFRRQPNYWHLPKGVYQARPDYNLYSFPYPTDLTKASFITNTYNKKLIKVQKQERYELEAAVNVIIDKDFWEVEDLGAALDHISQYNKIVFHEEVDLKKLLNDELIEKFVNLRLFKRPIELKKVSSVEQLISTAKVLKKIKSRKTIAFRPLTFITMSRELNKEEALDRYFDCIRSAAIANKHMVHLEYLVPREQAFKYAVIFKPFLNYRNNKKSFFSYLLEKEYYISAGEVLNNKQTWSNPVVSDIWRIYFRDREVFEDGFTVWGGHPDKERDKLDQGDAKIFYDTYIL